MFFNTPEEKDDGFELLPEGPYRVAVVDTEYKTTKKGDGRYVAVAFQVIGGLQKDRKVFSNFNIENPSEVAQRIGRGQFKRFLAAIGVTHALTSEAEFHKLAANKTLLIDVEQQKGNDGVVRNNVTNFKAKDHGDVLGRQPARGSNASAPPPSDVDVPF